MPTRRHFFVRAASGFAAFTLSLVGLGRLRAETPPPLGKNLPSGLTYQQQLEKGLKARRPTDFTFIATVITAVENGTITQKMVNETFDYARSKDSRYPFIYFQFVIRKRAAKLGVTL